MRVKKLLCYLTLPGVMLCLYYFSAAYALSCAAPVLDEARIQQAKIIFEGAVVESRGLTAKEKAFFAATPAMTKGGNVNNLKVYSFKITRGWKGVKGGERIEILRNTYWGDEFPKGEEFLIVSNEKIKDIYITRVCDPSLPIKFARDLGSIKTLEEIIGRGR